MTTTVMTIQGQIAKNPRLNALWHSMTEHERTHIASAKEAARRQRQEAEAALKSLEASDDAPTMKRPRHKARPKFSQSPDPDGHARTGQVRPDYATWLAMRPHVFGAIEAAAKLLDAQGKTPTTETITGLVGGCYSREVIEIACQELKRVGRLLC